MRALAFIGNKRFGMISIEITHLAKPQISNLLRPLENSSKTSNKEYIAQHLQPQYCSPLSPSGYEPIVANQPKWLRPMDKVCALPLDTPSRVKSFLKSIDYKVKFFAACKYDVWPNLISELSNSNIPTYVFAAHITENSQVLKSSFMRWNWAK